MLPELLGCSALHTAALPSMYMYSALQAAATVSSHLCLLQLLQFQQPQIRRTCCFIIIMEISRAIWTDAAIALLVAVAVNLSYNFILASIRSNRATKKSSRKPFVPQKFLTLRISNIPCSETNEERLHNILKYLPIEAQGIGGQPTVLGYSYSPTAVSRFSSQYAVATVTFEHAPAIKELEMVLKQKLGHAANDLRVDREFLGMTPLHNGGGSDARVEYVF